jgi:hypothetical protein
MLKHMRIASGLAVVLLLGVYGSAGASSNPLNPPRIKVAHYIGTATESYEPYGIGQQSDWHVHIDSTSCTDAGTSSLGTSCTVVADAYFRITVVTINGQHFKICEPDNDFNGHNAFAVYTPSSPVEPPTDSQGSAYMSPLYTDDLPVSPGTNAHFHFLTEDQIDGNLGTDWITGLGILKACGKLTGGKVSGDVFVNR